MEKADSLFVSAGDKITGPYSQEELLSWIRSGKANATLGVCPSGSSDWTTLGELAPQAVVIAAEQLLAYEQKKLRKTKSMLSIIAVIAITSLVWSATISSSSHKWRANAAKLEADIQKADQTIQQNDSKLRSLTDKLDAVAKELNRSKAAASDADKLAENAIAEARKKEQQATTMRTLAQTYAKRYVGVLKEIKGTTDHGKSARLIVSVNNAGPLNFDSAAIEAGIRNDLVRAGYQLLPEDDTSKRCFQLYAMVQQLEITEGINAAYLISLDCYCRAIAGDSTMKVNIFNDVSFGYAGKNAGYGTKLRDFYVNAVTKCVTIMDAVAKSSDELGDPSTGYDDLIAAGVSPDAGSDMISDQALASGSGVIVSDRPIILTNRHVIEGG